MGVVINYTAAGGGGGGSGGGGTWGSITGTLSSQTDLNTALSLKTTAEGVWSLTTNVATAPDGVTTFTPANGVYNPACNFLLCTGTGTRTLDGNTYNPNDYAVMNPALGQWVRVNSNAGTIANTTQVLVGNNLGGAVAGVPGVNFAPAPAFSCGVGIFIMPTHTVNANGAFTIGGTAFLSGMTDGFWGYFPANTITGSNAAGFYWVVLSSTTAGTVYNTTYTPGSTSPAIPASPTAFSGTTGGTGSNATATAITLVSVALGTNPMGPSGLIRHTIHTVSNTGQTAHNFNQKLNSTQTAWGGAVSSTNVLFGSVYTLRSAGRVDRQVGGYSYYDSVVTNSTPTRSSIDTSGATTLSYIATIGAAGDWCGFLGCDVEVWFGN